MKNHNEKIRSNFLKRLLTLTIMLSFVSTCLLNAQTGKPNFAGNWVLNTEKSTQPQGGQGGGMRMGGNFVAKQEANLLTVDRTRTNQNGETVTTTMKYTLDGKESINTSPRGDSKSVATWSADGKSLTIATSRTMDMNGETRTIKSSEVWSLNGGVLTIVSTFASPDGDRTITNVYDKK